MSTLRMQSQGRTATAVYAAAVAVAIPVILYQGRTQWFFWDDWAFLDPVGELTVSRLNEPWWGHWCFGPRLLHSALFTVFGIHHYLPYQAAVMLAHVTLTTLLWLVMRRAGINPWLATGFGILLLVFGPGRDNIVVAFQVTLSGAVALGLAQLILADHDGPVGRRDVVGVVCGLAAVAFAGVGIVMVFGTAVTALVRRGWRAALFHSLPVATVFLGWWGLVGRGTPSPRDLSAHSVEQLAEYAWLLVRNLVTVVGPTGVGLAWVALLAVGLVASARARIRSERGEWAATLGLFASGVLFLTVTALQRGRYLDVAVDPTPSRYTYLLAVFALPMVALGADQVARRWRFGLLIPLLAVAVSLPANVEALAEPREPLTVGAERRTLVLAEVAASFPDLREDKPAMGTLRSLGWVVESHRSGRVPSAPEVDGRIRSAAFAAVAFEAPRGDAASSCRALSDLRRVQLEVGDRLEVGGASPTTVTIGDVDRDLQTSFRTDPSGSLVRVVTAGPMTASVAAAIPIEVRRCR